MNDPRNNRSFLVHAFLLDDLSSDYGEHRRQLIRRFAWLLLPVLVLEGAWAVWRVDYYTLAMASFLCLGFVAELRWFNTRPWRLGNVFVAAFTVFYGFRAYHGVDAYSVWLGLPLAAMCFVALLGTWRGVLWLALLGMQYGVAIWLHARSGLDLAAHADFLFSLALSLLLAAGIALVWERVSGAMAYRITMMSETDALTHVLNRETFNERLVPQIEGHHANERPLSLLMVDLDHFKAINAEYGQTVGDTILREVATLVRETVLGTDVVGRFEGATFAVLLPGTRARDAGAVAERIRARVAMHGFHADHACHVSVGVAELTAIDGETEFTARAELALALAKQHGRNRVEQAAALAV